MTDKFQRKLEAFGGFPTIEQWLDKLPEPYRSKAILNRRGFPSKNTVSNTMWRAVSKAFNWENTPEGYDYWHDLKWKIKEGEIDYIDPQTNDMTEAQFQATLIKRYEADGWYVTKLIQCNKTGMPDLMLCKPNEVKWVEVKAAKGRLSAVQEYRHAELRARGFTVDVIFP